MTALTRTRSRVRDAALSMACQGRERLVRRMDERGDVPGWVLITLMTAGIVTVLWTVAEDQLVGLFEDAMNQVRDR